MTDTSARLPTLIAPHGGTLINRLLKGAMADATREAAKTLPTVVLSKMNTADLEMIAIGAYSPLTGFMKQADYLSVVHDMHLSNGLPWTVPLTLTVDADVAKDIKAGQLVALAEQTKAGDIRQLAVMDVEEKYTYDKELEAEKVYGTTAEAHPGVARLYGLGDVLLAGDIHVFDLPEAAQNDFPEIRYKPADSRKLFQEHGWRQIVAFQTRNPIHRAHEYLQKVALEMVDGLYIHPLVGETKKDDIPADVRMKTYRVVIDNYYPDNRVELGVFPAAMRYAGPREAVFHAIARKNYGCTHFIVGRDHAGVGKYYGTYDAQMIFDQFDSKLIDITPLRFEHAFYSKSEGKVVTAKTTRTTKDDWVFLSGTQVREKLRAGEQLPIEFTRPEVSAILVEAMQGKPE